MARYDKDLNNSKKKNSGDLYDEISRVGGGGGGGGSTNPGGSDTQVQYNDGGSFGGSANLTYDGTNLTAQQISASTHVSASTYYGDGSNLTGIAGGGGGGAAFPYTGSAEITGSLQVIGDIKTIDGLYLNRSIISSSITIPVGFNASMVGPLDFAVGTTLTVPTGSEFVVY